MNGCELGVQTVFGAQHARIKRQCRQTRCFVRDDDARFGTFPFVARALYVFGPVRGVDHQFQLQTSSVQRRLLELRTSLSTSRRTRSTSIQLPLQRDSDLPRVILPIDIRCAHVVDGA